MPEKKMPVWAQRVGSLGVSAWENVTKSGETKKTVRIENSYKKREEEKWTTEKVRISENKLDELINLLQRAKAELNKPREE